MKLSKTLIAALMAAVMAATADRDEICRVEKTTGKQVCYPKIFEPTEDWQVVWPEQVIPAGLHVRMDYEKGIKEAKLNDPNEKIENVAVAIGEEVPEDQIVIEDLTGEDEKLSANEKVQRAIEKAIKEKRIKQGHKPNPHIPQSDHEQFSDAVEALRDYKVNGRSALLPIALSQLEELAHEIDFGIALSAEGPISALVAAIKDAELRVEPKIMAARTLGASLRNNPHALGKALETKSVDLVKSLLETMSQAVTDESDKLASSLVYALSAVLKTRETVARFVDLNGGKALRELYEQGSEDLKSRCSTLVEDVLATPDLHEDFKSITGAVEKRSPNWWQDELKEWSGVFQKSLTSKLPAKGQAKVYSSLSAIRRNFRDAVDISDEFLKWLDHPIKAASYVEEELAKQIREDRHTLWGNPKVRKYDDRDEL